MYKRNKYSKNKTQKTTFEKNITNKIQLIQPEPERYLFAVEWWAGGCPVFVFLFLSKVFCLSFVFVVFA